MDSPMGAFHPFLTFSVVTVHAQGLITIRLRLPQPPQESPSSLSRRLRAL